jgi:uncharacterized repeat protein (TIGR03806 family)
MRSFAMSLRFLFILFMVAAITGCSHENVNFCNIANGEAPALLSASGCVNMADPAQAAAGTIPYDINEPFWSDGAEKHRFMALPEDTRIDIDAAGDFILPVGTVLIKHFRINGRYIETRFFTRSSADTWNGYSYEWNEAQTEAQLLPFRKELPMAGQSWLFPGRDQCQQCHTAAAGFSLGLEIAQLNKDYSYARAGASVNQLDYLQALGVLAEVPPALRNLKLPSSKDHSHTLNDRARSYLHSNCSHCHRPNGGTESTMDLRFNTPFADMNLCDARPRLGDFSIPDARLLAPGDYKRSILWVRTSRSDNNRMPLLFSDVVDADGVRLIEEWINGLSGCI